jgi:hypothetical protein
VIEIEGEEKIMTDWKKRITINPDQCGGRPCIRGMRIRVLSMGATGKWMANVNR